MTLPHPRTPIHVRLEFKLEDAWIGVFWKRTPQGREAKKTDIWVCLVPCLPVHITIGGSE